MDMYEIRQFFDDPCESKSIRCRGSIAVPAVHGNGSRELKAKTSVGYTSDRMRDLQSWHQRISNAPGTKGFIERYRRYQTSDESSKGCCRKILRSLTVQALCTRPNEDRRTSRNNVETRPTCGLGQAVLHSLCKATDKWRLLIDSLESARVPP